MTDSVNEAAQGDPEPLATTGMNLQDYLNCDLVIADMEVTSKKRLLQQFAKLIAENSNGDDGNRLGLDLIFDTLYNRERLGCTALGKGIALPHGRIEGLGKPVISIARLKPPVDYDAPDGLPVWLAVCLLVPTDAPEVHLDLLAVLAEKFSDEQFTAAVKQARTAEALYRFFVSDHAAGEYAAS